MKNKNTNIINEVKKFIDNSSNETSESKEKLKDEDIVERLISDKVKTLDNLIDKEIKKWVNLNAEKISREIIAEKIKKLFK